MKLTDLINILQMLQKKLLKNHIKTYQILTANHTSTRVTPWTTHSQTIILLLKRVKKTSAHGSDGIPARLFK